MAQKPYIIGSLGPKALKYASFEGKGLRLHRNVCPEGHSREVLSFAQHRIGRAPTFRKRRGGELRVCLGRSRTVDDIIPALP